MIEIRDLRKSYGQHIAVAGVSLEIQARETFGLLGPNGAGKTTLMHMLAGVLRPDAGTITIDGSSDPERPEVRRKLGIAPQSLALYEDLTAEENLSFFSKLYGLRGDRLRERVAWGLAFAQLADRKDDRVGTYSGGMKRRLNLACALVHDPPVLLLDEPTVGVDPQSRNHLLENIEQLTRQGKTIVYTTHYMEEAQRLCNRVGVIDHGKVLALDSVANLLERFGGDPIVEIEVESAPPDVALPGTREGNSLRLQTARPLDELMALSARGVKMASLKVEQPNLEMVFLALTGRRLRD